MVKRVSGSLEDIVILGRKQMYITISRVEHQHERVLTCRGIVQEAMEVLTGEYVYVKITQ